MVYVGDGSSFDLCTRTIILKIRLLEKKKINSVLHYSHFVYQKSCRRTYLLSRSDTSKYTNQCEWLKQVLKWMF